MKRIVKIINKSKYDLPEYKTSGSAGFDFRANLARPMAILPGRRAIIPTGLFMELPEGTELQIRTRSGLAAKHGVIVLNSPGTVDSDYRDEVCIIIANLGDQIFEINPGDRIAQGVLKIYETVEFEVVEKLTEESNREGGFGSTGIK